MSDDIKLDVAKRDVFGKKVKSLRNNGEIPAVIHNHGKASVHIKIDERKLRKAYSEAGKNHPVIVSVGNKDYYALIKDLVYEPASHKLHHAVFQAVRADETTTADIPVHLTGDSPAEKAGLQIIQQTDHIEVEALPKDLPESFEVDVSNLSEIGNRISISDLNVPNEVEIKTDTANLIAIVEEPRDQIADADKALEEMKEQEEAEAELAEEETMEGEEGAEGEKTTEEQPKGGESEGEIRPGGKKEFEDKEQGHNTTKK